MPHPLSTATLILALTFAVSIVLVLNPTLGRQGEAWIRHRVIITPHHDPIDLDQHRPRRVSR